MGIIQEVIRGMEGIIIIIEEIIIEIKITIELGVGNLQETRIGTEETIEACK